MNPLAALGRVTLAFLAATGRVALFTVSGLSHCARPPIYPRLIARKIADRIAMIHKGRIIWAGPTAQIESSGNDHVDQFIHGRAEGPIRMEVRAL